MITCLGIGVSEVHTDPRPSFLGGAVEVHYPPMVNIVADKWPDQATVCVVAALFSDMGSIPTSGHHLNITNLGLNAVAGSNISSHADATPMQRKELHLHGTML